MTLERAPSRDEPELIGTDWPQLPAVAYTRDGQEIRPNDDLWSFRKRGDGGGVLSLDWSTLHGLSPKMTQIAKVMLAGRASTHAPYSTRNDFEMLRRLGAWYRDSPTAERTELDWSRIDTKLCERFLAFGMTGAHRGNEFARLRDLYRFGVLALRHEDFSEAVLLALETIRAAGNLKGNAVRDGDPEQGYFTPPEIDLILERLGADAGTPEQRASVWLALETGRNALQYTLLLNSDLTRVSVIVQAKPRRLYQINTRRIKKRTVVDGRVSWPISEALGDFLWSLRHGSDGDRLLSWLDEEQPEQALAHHMRAWARATKLISPRTQKVMRLNPRRFRVTMMTNAADEGASEEHLAILADHSDLQNIQVYLDRSPLFLLRIRDKVDAIYDPMVRRFKGTFTTTEEAARAGAPVIPGNAAHLPLLDVGGIGVCGSKKVCRLLPPLTCYGCPFFVAFRDGPHRQVIVALEKSMLRMSERIALQIANTLAAVREVVALIEAKDESGKVA